MCVVFVVENGGTLLVEVDNARNNVLSFRGITGGDNSNKRCLSTTGS